MLVLIACSVPSPVDLLETAPVVVPVDVATESEVVASMDALHPAELVLADDLWIADYGNQAILRVRDGAAEVAARATWRVPEVAVGEGRVFWVVDTTYATVHEPRQDATIWSMPTAGGDPVRVVPPQVQINDVAVRGAALVWVRRGTWGTDPDDRHHLGDAALIRAEVDGSGTVTLADGLPEIADIAVDDTHVWMMVSGAPPNVADGTIRRVPLAGGAVETVAEVVRGPAELVLDGEHVYWTTSGELFGPGRGAIWRMPRAGGPSEVVVHGPRWPQKLAVDGGTVCWTDSPGGRAPNPILCRRADGPVMQLGTADIPTALALRGDRLLVGELKANRVVRYTLPNAGR